MTQFARTWPRLRIGELWVDVLRFDEAIDAVEALVRAGEGGCVFTPNVDHVVNAEEMSEFREAYRQAQLSLVDGMPLLWVSPLLGRRLPAKLSGSDLAMPLMERAALRRWRVFLLGAGPGVAQVAAERIRAQHDVEFVGCESPVIDLSRPEADAEVIQRVRAARPDVLFLALGSPKQELWAHRLSPELGATVMICVGAALDFIAGVVPRAPQWVSGMGFEWLFRLSREPKRLWRRYLLQDPKFVRTVFRTLRRPREERVLPPRA